MIQNLSMDVNKGYLYGFQQEEVERVLVAAANAGVLQGAEYCNVCDNRDNCLSHQESLTVWLNCSSFKLSLTRFQMVAEDLHEESMRLPGT